VLAPFDKLTTGVEQKMVVRINGTGAVAIDAQHEDGTRLEVTRIAAHSGSTFDAIFPGTDEWGLFLTFPKAGCWRIEVRRVDASADFYLAVTAN
jgi:hypothetical protein